METMVEAVSTQPRVELMRQLQAEHSYVTWRLGYFNPDYLRSMTEVHVFAHELRKSVTIHLDSMSSLSFMKPTLFENLEKHHKKLPTVQYIRTGYKKFFCVQKYVDLHMRNLSGDYVKVRFFPSPGLETDPNVNYLVSLSAAVSLGYTGFMKQEDIVIKNVLPDYVLRNTNCMIYLPI